MNPVDDLTFLDPVTPPPPADSAERAAVRRRGRRRRLARLTLTSSPVVLAVAAAVAIGIAVTAGPNTQATVVPLEPQHLNMTGAAPTAPGCPAGRVLQSITRHGVTYTAVDDHESSPWFVGVCVRLADGTVFHQTQSGIEFTPFPDGSYFAVDKLGHIFTNLAPGNISGVLVLVPGPDTVKVLGIYNYGLVQQTAPVFTLRIADDTCIPDCAYGAIQNYRAVWDSATDTYVLHDPPLSKFLGYQPQVPDPLHDYEFAPEIFRTSGGAALYPALLDTGVADLVRWHVTAGSKPFTVHLGDFVQAVTHRACAVAPPSSTSVDGHIVEPHTSYSFEASCPFDEDARQSVSYAPGGKVVARWR